MAMNEPGYHGDIQSYGMSDLVGMLFRNKKKVVFIPLLLLSLAILVILYAPRKYRSEAKVYLQVGRESVKLDPTATTGDTISMQSINRASEIVTAMESLKSRGTIERAVDKLSPETVLGNGGIGEKQSNVLIQTLKSARW